MGGGGNSLLAQQQRQQQRISRDNYYGGVPNNECYDDGMRGGYRGINGHYDESGVSRYYGQQRLYGIMDMQLPHDYDCNVYLQ